MNARRIMLIAGVLGVALAAAIYFAQPTMLSGAQGSPTPARAQYPEYIERALTDLAQRLGVAADEIAVSSAEPQTWNDASLGLPEAGMMYAQVITQGHVVTLTYAGRAYVYHVSGETVKLRP